MLWTVRYCQILKVKFGLFKLVDINIAEVNLCVHFLLQCTISHVVSQKEGGKLVLVHILQNR